MKPIAIFYHCVFFLGDPPKLRQEALWVAREQMLALQGSGLMQAANEIHAGVNGGEESARLPANPLPHKAVVSYFGLASHSENFTILLLQDWVKTHPGWNVLYFHAKGATKEWGSSEFESSRLWRRTMMQDLVTNWRQCVAELDNGFDIVCSHWKWHQADGTQNLAAGNFWWAKADFLATLPSMLLRERIKQDGIGSLSSRYEAEVWIGNGRIPTVRQFRPNGGPGIP